MSATNKLKVYEGPDPSLPSTAGDPEDPEDPEDQEDQETSAEPLTSVQSPTPTPTPKPTPKPKLSYAQRKKQAIAQVIHILGYHQVEPWTTLINSSCKKEQDDLSDCFLQGLYMAKQKCDAREKRRIQRVKKMQKLMKKNRTPTRGKKAKAKAKAESE